MTGTRLEGLYDSLSRFQWWRRRLSGASPGEALEMHKRLRASKGDDGGNAGPAAGCASINDWLFELSGLPTDPQGDSRVLDIGCGFGATLVAWAKRSAGRFVGLSLSGYQIDKARIVARRAGLGKKCSFRQQGFDDPIEGEFDVVVSIETLLHARDLAKTMQHLSTCTSPGAAIVLVEDMAVDAAVAEETAGRDLLQNWSSDRLHSEEDYRAALAGAGFVVGRDIDLTGQVDFPTESDWSARERRLRRWRRWTPFGRTVIDAFLGGIAMERLYAAGRLRYRAMVARREGGAA